jgi:hypothetical protein
MAEATKEKKADKSEGAAQTCRAPKCKQPVRAKGYCRKHYIAWRRGKVGAKHRYNICSKPDCRKPATTAGRCAEHVKGRKPAAGGEAAPAA